MEMIKINLEIIGFYLNECNADKSILSGTLRIRLPDYGFDILGISASKRKNFWYFLLPGRNQIHHENGNFIRFPFLVFNDKEKQIALMESIRSQGPVFIERRLADTVNPLKIPLKQKPNQKAAKLANKTAPAPEAKEMASNLKSKGKVWIDPPKKLASRSFTK